MLKSIIRLRDDSEIGSGAGQDNAILSCTVTECVNGGNELTIGSVCTACLELQIIAKGGSLPLSPGDEGELYKEDETGTRTRAGIFHLESPTKKSDNVYKITAYDRVSQLDKDLSVWLKELSDWPYTLSKLASMVCAQCGLFCNTDAMLNADFPVPQFYKSGVTGRQLMQWVGEIAGCFCRATPEGEIELAWYTDSGVTVSASGERYYFAGALTYQDFAVAAVDAVKLRLADSSDGAVWPAGEAENPYIITGNAILLANVSEDLLPYLNIIQGRLAELPEYRPCKVSLPAGLDIRAGNTVQVTDKHGNQFTTLVMSKTQSGQRDTLECTGSQNRSSTTAANSKSVGQVAQAAVDSQTQTQIFNKLTNGGEALGLFMLNGQLYINASYLTTGILASKDGNAFYLDLDKGILRMQATELSIGGKSVKDIAEASVEELSQEEIFDKLTNGQANQGIYLNGTNLYLNASCMKTGTLAAERIDVANLVAQKLRTESDGTVLEVQDGVMRMSAGDAVVAQIYYTGGVPEIMMNSVEQISRFGSGGVDFSLSDKGEMAGIGVETLEGQPVGAVYADVFRQRSASVAPKVFGKTVQWKDNGDGTYTLIGT